MGCSSCSYGSSGTPTGCGNKGHCTSGSCNKMNTYDWISAKEIYDPSEFNVIEVSFKKGARKDFYVNNNRINAITGDMVAVEAQNGYDVGRVSLCGELVRMQMKKKRITEDRVVYKVVRVANHRDLEKLSEARNLEQATLVRSRAIARTLGLDMKIGDVEYQGDKKKATFYYTAEGRVDFRELVRSYANEFRVKVEMRQIGARQESARIGGIGSCGRELCCSTWLSDFKSVTTSAARYQNIAINQTKLSGQCGRLKCCLNYELDSYMDALEDFPVSADYILTSKGKAALIKTDIFKGLMFYTVIDAKVRGPIVALDKDRVKEILAMNKKGEVPDELVSVQKASTVEIEKEYEFEDVTGAIELPMEKKKKRSNSRNKNRSNRTRPKDRKGNSGNHQNKSSNQPKNKPGPKGDQ